MPVAAGGRFRIEEPQEDRRNERYLEPIARCLFVEADRDRRPMKGLCVRAPLEGRIRVDSSAVTILCCPHTIGMLPPPDRAGAAWAAPSTSGTSRICCAGRPSLQWTESRHAADPLAHESDIALPTIVRRSGDRWRRDEATAGLLTKRPGIPVRRVHETRRRETGETQFRRRSRARSRSDTTPLISPAEPPASAWSACAQPCTGDAASQLSSNTSTRGVEERITKLL